MSGAFCYGCGSQAGGSQTGAAGTLLMAYTATLGNGITATLSAEDQTMRRGVIWDATTDALPIGNTPGPVSQTDDYNLTPLPVGDTAAQAIPDIRCAPPL